MSLEVVDLRLLDSAQITYAPRGAGKAEIYSEHLAQRGVEPKVVGTQLWS